jgi:hypothetical protein
MSENTANRPSRSASSHLDGCTVCANLTRPTAYRWLGLTNWIPVHHSVGWIRDDLRGAIESLKPGQEIELDYRGDHEGAPRIAIHRSLDDVISASGPADWVTVAGQMSWNLSLDVTSDRDTSLVHMLMSFLMRLRGAGYIELPAPEKPQ